ncbi:RNA polymerase II transcription elongation factor-domain-containing protein [Mycena metata]|uniref:RNA polymerase II transcription elongation factor-domain-containing protein n=1 Tax=Mycena metata TaxID=1033252 RepID=A0AAD7HQC4_9AGAR|nr:RNA polymerase II transcription elongation factor-domain-containing protein [Mycena metata]
MASSAESWIPKGTHEVQIGPSLNKALKARKGGPPPQVKRTGPPEKDFYSFRYNFRPPSVETTKPGSIQINRAKDATSSTIIVEHPSSQPGETHVYTGTEAAVKEVDCILIYDEETGSYKLEKLESSIILNYGHKAHAASLPASSASTPKLETDTEGTRLSQDADAEGDIDDELPSHFFAVPEESEEEEDLEPVPVLPPPPPPPAKPAKAAPAPKQRPEPVAPRPTKPVPQRKKKAAAPPPPPQSALPPVQVDADEEDLEFGRPAMKRAKHTAPAPPAPVPAPVAFSLPGSSSGIWVPPPAPHAQSSKAPPPSAPSPIAVADDSDEEDDWDEVAAAVPPPDAETPGEIDMNEFERTLEMEMEAEMEEEQEQDEEGSEQEDFLAAALPQALDSAATPIRPISSLVGFSDEEFSSSEDSDDD